MSGPSRETSGCFLIIDSVMSMRGAYTALSFFSITTCELDGRATVSPDRKKSRKGETVRSHLDRQILANNIAEQSARIQNHNAFEARCESRRRFWNATVFFAVATFVLVLARYAAGV